MFPKDLLLLSLRGFLVRFICFLFASFVFYLIILTGWLFDDFDA